MSNDELGLFIDNNRTAFKPGEMLELSVLWALSSKPTSLEVRLFWYTRGKGTEDVEVIATEQISAQAAAGEAKIRFTLPRSPWSFSGKLISLIWAVELVAEPQSRTARCEFFLSPSGKEILLHA
ncbi:MAG: hypothetical protein QM715_11610 [Nibricoccus sp.]